MDVNDRAADIESLQEIDLFERLDEVLGHLLARWGQQHTPNT